MKISEKWLRQWCNCDLDTQQIADTLTMAGLEVKAIEPIIAKFSKVVVAEILDIQPHPKSESLNVVKLNYGKSRNSNVVCGASNLTLKMKVPLALIGAKLANGLVISKKRIQGIVSNGMLCSAWELAVDSDDSGIMQLDKNAKCGEKLSNYLDLPDQVFEIDLTPNRGDCVGVIGVARELAALTLKKIKSTAVKPITSEIKSKLAIKVNVKSQCPRYVGRVIKNINAKAKTPDWIKQKLIKSAVRPISAVVDISNFVMLETGQPTHAFDLDKLKGGIVVDTAKKGEQLKLLDESIVKFKGTELLINDHQGPVALAGVMGGEETAITDNTTNVFLESAYFQPQAVSSVVRKHSIHTDASYRYERGVDPFLQEKAAQRVTELIIQICGGQAGHINNVFSQVDTPKKQPIMLRLAQINRILGTNINQRDAERFLKRLGCQVSRQIKSLKVVPPSYRFDLDKEHDLIEEVARLYGYDNIPSINEKSVTGKHSLPENQISTSRFRNLMVDRGYNDVITYSFVNPQLQEKFHHSEKSIALKNPLNENLSVMRLSMISGLLGVLKDNYNRQHRRIRLFEIGNIFYYEKNNTIQQPTLAAVATGSFADEQWGLKNREVDFFDLKSDIEELARLSFTNSKLSFKAETRDGFHPGQYAKIYSGRYFLGFIGQILPSITRQLNIEQTVYLFQLNLTILSKSIIPAYKRISRFPSTRRDLSLIIKHNLSIEDLINQTRLVAGDLLSNVNIFDVYTGKPIEFGYKSVSLGLTFQASERTLCEGELDEITSRILHHLETKYDAQLRF